MAQNLKVIAGESSTIAISITGIDDIQSVKGFINEVEHDLVLTNGVWLLKLTSQQNDRQAASNEYFSICLSSTSLGIRKIDKVLQISYSISNANTVDANAVSNHIDVTIPITYESVTDDDVTVDPIVKTIYSTASLTADEIEAKLDEKYGSTAWRDTQSQLTDSQIVTAVNNELGNEDWQTPGEGGGASNPNVFVPTQASDFTSPNAANAGKTWEIQNDITIPLGSTCDFTNCSDVIFKDGGGKIDFQDSTIKFVDVDFSFDCLGTVFDLMSATIDNASTFKHCNINVANFGLVGDGDRDAGTGTDNRNVFMQCQKIWNTSTGIARVKGKGIYACSVVDEPTYAWDTPTNIYITGKVSFIMDDDVALMVLPNDMLKYHFISLWGAEEGEISGGLLIGDAKNHDYTQGASEWNHGIYYSFGTSHYKIKTPCTEFSGDGVVHSYCQYPNYTGMADESFIDGFDLSEVDGSTVVDSNLSYSKLLDISSGYFADWGKFLFTGGAYGATGLQVFKYWAAYYNDTPASTETDPTIGFISKTSDLAVHDEVDIPDIGAKYVRLIVYTPDVWADATLDFKACNLSKNVTIEQPYSTMNIRQACSNPSSLSIIQNCEFYKNGRRFDLTPGSPGFHIDIEDGYQRNYKIKILNNTFRDAKGGDIILKGCRDCEIKGNKFLNHTIPDWVSVNIISTTSGRRTVFTENYVENRQMEIGEEDKVFNNQFRDVEFVFSMEEERLEDNKDIYNPRFEIASTTGGAKAYIRNNNFIFDRPIEEDEYTFAMEPESGNLVWENVHFDLRGHLYPSKFSQSWGAGILSEGHIDGFTMVNGKAADQRDYRLRFSNMDINDMHISTSLDIRNGIAKDTKLTNSSYEGFLQLYLTEYPNTATGDFTKYTLENIDILIPVQRLVESNNYAFFTNTKDVDIDVTNMTIDLTPLGNTYYGDKIMNLPHNGTTVFRKSTFKSSKVGCTIDLTARATGGAVTFIDCDFEGVAVTLRSGDKRLFTKAHPDLEVHADNTEATNAGIPVGYMYRKSTGESMIVV